MTKSKNKFLSLITIYGKANKLKIFIAIILAIMATISSLLFTYSIRELLDSIPKGGSSNYSYYIKIIIFIAVDMMGSVASFYILGKVGNSVVRNIRNQLLETSIYLPSKYFQDNKKGELTSRIVNDTGILYDVISSTIPNFVTGIVSIIGSLIALFMINKTLSLMILLIIPIMIFVMKPIGNVLSSIASRMQTLTAKLNQSTTEALLAHDLIKSLNAEKKSLYDIKIQNDEIYDTNIKQLKILSVLNPLMNIIIFFAIFLIIIVGGIYVQTGILTMGTFIAFIIYAIQLISPATNMATLYISIKKSVGATERISIILDTPIETSQGLITFEEFNQLEVIDGEFTYNHNYIMNNINLCINKGEIIGIIGESGSGKSTLLKILTSLYPINSGSILYNGVNVKDYDLFKLRRKMAYVDQDKSLIGKTIKDNLLYGVEDYDISDSDMWDILDEVGLSSFINELDLGLDTYIGELGNQLSGGQKQRLAIARALLRNNDIFFFDEITSALDKENKDLINTLIYNLVHKKNKTVVYVTHEIQENNFFDKVYQIKDGQITLK